MVTRLPVTLISLKSATVTLFDFVFYLINYSAANVRAPVGARAYDGIHVTYYVILILSLHIFEILLNMPR